jgi:Outer membrane protein beta-barrel domain
VKDNTNSKSMKKVLMLLLTTAFTGTLAFAQDGENDLKNFRFGLKAVPMITWYKPDDAAKFESNGAMLKFGYGLSTEFRLNKVAAFATGIQIDYDGGKINFKDTAYYFLSRDNELIEPGDTADFTGESAYTLKKRSYNTTYVTIPLTLKLKTNEIGYMTYYGQFGVNASVRARSRVNDEVNLLPGGASATQTKLLNSSDMQLMKLALNVGLGAEYNIQGSTSLVFGINYINGFTNVAKKESRYLFRTPSNNNGPLKQDFRANAVQITVGVLF